MNGRTKNNRAVSDTADERRTLGIKAYFSDGSTWRFTSTYGDSGPEDRAYATAHLWSEVARLLDLDILHAGRVPQEIA
jgi:hypothetical protein